MFFYCTSAKSAHALEREEAADNFLKTATAEMTKAES